MTSAPSTGCVASRRASSASAGGQLEQPSEVKSSTTTALREAAGAAFDFAASSFKASVPPDPRPPSVTAATAKTASATTQNTIADSFLIISPVQIVLLK